MQNKEFEKFDKAMRDVLKVPHTEIKVKLEAEKQPKEEIEEIFRFPRGSLVG